MTKYNLYNFTTLTILLTYVQLQYINQSLLLFNVPKHTLLELNIFKCVISKELVMYTSYTSDLMGYQLP